MPPKGRSLDDLPLAAYTTGVDPGELPEPVESEPVPGPSGAPFALSGAAVATYESGFGDHPGDAPQDARPPFREVLLRPREHARDPRLLLSGVIGLGVVLLGLSLLTGGSRTADAGATATQSPPPAVPVAAESGTATLVLTGGVEGTFELTGPAGQAASGSGFSAMWADTLATVLKLDGTVDRGTRTTDANLVLSWVVYVDGRPVTFTSQARECTIGMATQPKAVSGTFVCKKLKSDDGKVTVGASGTYRT